MAGQTPIGGIIEVQVDGESIDIAVGDVECDDGVPMAAMIVGGHGRAVGAKLEPRSPSISGEIHITDFAKYRALKLKRDATCTVRFPHGTFLLRGALFSSDAGVKSGEAKAPFKFVGVEADWV